MDNPTSYASVWIGLRIDRIGWSEYIAEIKRKRGKPTITPNIDAR
ncbi:MAG: hypothetical protein N3E44_04955 [Candidatus Bathyarchaeota archaeon]|nr:hypothetical protein [Candidatus Bathyarchaeota archaeon]